MNGSLMISPFPVGHQFTLKYNNQDLLHNYFNNNTKKFFIFVF